MDQDPFKKAEELDIRIENATPDDWEVCKELRTLALTGKDARKFAATPEMVTEEEARGEKEWREDLSNPNIIFVLSKLGYQTVGFGRAIRRGNNNWHMGWAYTKENFRNKGLGTKNSEFRLKEIVKRNGDKVTMGVMTENLDSIKIAEKLGFKKKGDEITVMKGENKDIPNTYQIMELDLTKNKDSI